MTDSVAKSSTPLDVLFLVRGFAADGPGRLVLCLLQHLNPEAIRPHVVALDAQGPLREGFEAAVSRLGGTLDAIPSGWAGLKAAVRFIEGCPWFSRISVVNAHLMRPDAVGRALCRRHPIPYLLTDHGVHAWSDKGGLLRPIVRTWYRTTLPRGARIIAVSHKVARDLVGEGIPADRVVTIVNGIAVAPPNRQSDSKARLRQALGLARPEIPAVLMLGGLTANKHHALGLLACRELSLAGLPLVPVICGDGPLRASLEASAKAMGLLAHFTGAVADPSPWLGACDVLLHPSAQESFGLAPVEGLLAGLPVVGRAASGLEDILPAAPLAFLATGQGTAAWSGALRQALACSVDAELSAARRAFAASRYSAERMAAEYAGLFVQARGMAAGG